MTENEIKQRIRKSESQILTDYNSFINAAAEVGRIANKAAEDERSEEIRAAKIKKFKYTFFPILIALIGMIFSTEVLDSSGGFAIFLIGGGIVAYMLHQNAQKEQREIEQRTRGTVDTVHYQRTVLDTKINNNQDI